MAQIQHPNKKWYLLTLVASRLQTHLATPDSLNYTEPEIASLFGVSTRTVKRWKKEAYNYLSRPDVSLNLLKRGERTKNSIPIGGDKELEQAEKLNQQRLTGRRKVTINYGY